MRRLYVLRHAKSSWDDASLADFDRPLNMRGREAAPFMGRLVRDRGLLPDVILSSPASRASETARLVAHEARLDQPIRFDDRIYEASPQTLLKVLSELEDGFLSAMLVGHNPGIEGLIRVLTGQLTAMPTAALAVIDLNIASWSDIGLSAGKLAEVVRPKEVEELT